MPKPRCQRNGCRRTCTEFTVLFTRRKIPRLESRQFCSEDCLYREYEAELLERWERLQPERHSKLLRPRIGTILLQNSLITAGQLAKAVQLQRQTHEGRLGDWLLRLGFLEEQHITMALSRQFGIPCIHLEKADLQSEAFSLVPAPVAKCAHFLPVSFDGDKSTLRIAATGPLDFHHQEAIRRMLRAAVFTYIGDESLIEHLLQQRYHADDLDPAKAPSFGSLDELLDLGRGLLQLAVRERADDIRLELVPEYFWVRLDFAGKVRHHIYKHSEPLLKIASAANNR